MSIVGVGTQGGKQGEKVGNISDEFNGFYDALIKSHMPCDIIDEESVRSEDIFKYDLIVLPNVACTGKDFNGRLREYVKQGGNVIASFETSICDENGKRGESLGLEDLFGLRILRTPIKPYPHFYFFRQDNKYPYVFSDITADMLPAPLISMEAELAGAEIISRYSVKFTGWDGSEILPSEFPAITVHEYGKGRAVFLAGVFGEQYWTYKQPDIRILLKNLFCMLSRQDVSADNLPISVELTHRENSERNLEMISLINYSGGLSRPFEMIQTINDVKIFVNTAHNSAKALLSDTKIAVEKHENTLILTLQKLDLFETIVLE